jgi:AraC-like DNA-binding protein
VRVFRDGGLGRAAGFLDAMFSSAVTLLTDRLPGFRVARVQLGRPRPARAQPYFDLYGVMPEFGADENAVSFHRSWLDTPMRGSDGVLAEILMQQAMSLLRETPHVHPFIARVQKVVLDGLARGATSLSVVAHATGTTPRTLRRRLSELGVRFQGLIDALRRELARQFLRSGDASVADIAERLGFASSSAFQRAFQRWERMSPSAYRRLAREGSSEQP